MSASELNLRQLGNIDLICDFFSCCMLVTESGTDRDSLDISELSQDSGSLSTTCQTFYNNFFLIMCAVSFVMRLDILFRGSVAVANSACKLLCSAPIGRRH